MRTADAVQHFKGQSALARALGIKQGSVGGWGDLPPDARQLQIELLTGGALKAEPGCMERVLGLDKLTSKAKPD